MRLPRRKRSAPPADTEIVFIWCCRKGGRVSALICLLDSLTKDRIAWVCDQHEARLTGERG